MSGVEVPVALVVIGMAIEFAEKAEKYGKLLNEWTNQIPVVPDPLIHSLKKVHAELSEIQDQGLAAWVTLREDNITELLATSTAALQTANAFMQSGAPPSDSNWASRLSHADRDSLVAVQTFTGDLHRGVWLRPESIKAISWSGDPTSYHYGWMLHLPDRAERHSFNRVWDHRWGLPAAIYTITVRIVVLQALGVDKDTMRPEIKRYNDFIAAVFQKMESGVRSLGKLSEKQIQNIATQGVPIAVADIYGGYFVGGLFDPMSMKHPKYAHIPLDGLPIPNTAGVMNTILDNKDKLTKHYSNHVKVKIGLAKLLEFAGQLETLLDRLAIPSDKLLALSQVGIDFSVAEAELRQWLNDPIFTPYPAIAEALLKLLGSKHLVKPVFLDVIVFNYENSPGVSSPHNLADVDLTVLRAAVVKGYNNRYGEVVTDFHSLVR